MHFLRPHPCCLVSSRPLSFVFCYPVICILLQLPLLNNANINHIQITVHTTRTTTTTTTLQLQQQQQQQQAHHYQHHHTLPHALAPPVVVSVQHVQSTLPRLHTTPSGAQLTQLRVSPHMRGTVISDLSFESGLSDDYALPPDAVSESTCMDASMPSLLMRQSYVDSPSKKLESLEKVK